MRIKTYSSDLPAASWQVIKKIIQVLRRRKWDLKEVVNAVLYVTKNGCVWREVPGEFPPWQTVYYYFSKWVKDGTWKSISDCLTTDYREKQGKKSQPTVAIVDSQSAKNSATCGKDVGVDGGKLVKGRKRFYIVDTMGNLLDSFVVAANSHDGTTAARKWEGLAWQNPLLDEVETVFADGTFRGTFSQEMLEKHGIEVEIPTVPIARKGKVDIHQKRWVVERTIGWTLANRRCSRDYQRKAEHANAFIIIGNIKRLAQKIT